MKFCQILSTLSNIVKFCQILSNPVKYYQILSNFVKSCEILSNSVISYQILSSPIRSCQTCPIFSNLSKTVQPAQPIWTIFSVLLFQMRCCILLFTLSTVIFSCHTSPFGIPFSIQLKAFRKLLGQKLEPLNTIQDEQTPLFKFKVTNTNRELKRQDKVNTIATNVEKCTSL